MPNLILFTQNTMAQNKYALARYYIIDNLLHRYKYVKTAYIVECCQEKTGYTVSPRTIQMDIEAMKNDSFLGFYAPIEYCTKNKAYYYIQPDYTLSPFSIHSNEIRMLEELLEIVKCKINSEYYYLIKRIIQKIKFHHIE